jgi:dipeptide/tripeptide permease
MRQRTSDVQRRSDTIMHEHAHFAEKRLSWRFPATFWVANVSELFERAAFYGMFIAITVYLTREVGFSDVGATSLSGCFSFLIYFLPAFLGPLADKVGFRPALMIAFVSLMFGYALLGAFQFKFTAAAALVLVAFGGAIVKPVILGTAAKCSDTLHRARAFSIFYMMVNIGSFSGKTVAPLLRQGCNVPFIGHIEFGLVYINFYAAAMALCALILVAVAYRSPDTQGAGKSLEEVWHGFVRVVGNGRFMCLILIVAGFWTIQGQLYASMPLYILRMVGERARPEWLANINPLVVVCCVALITQKMRTVRPEISIAIALAIIPCSALSLGLSPILEARSGNSISILGLALHPITVMAIIGIALQGLAECFLSPKFMEYASRLARPGEEGLYMGFQNLPPSIAWLVGFVAAGFLLNAFCPDPAKLQLTDPAQYAQWQAALAGHGPMPAAYAHAHYIWYVFAAIGVAAFIALLVFKSVTDRIDRQAGRV